MIGILFGVATGVMFAFIINEERLRAYNSHALYLQRFDNEPVSKEQRLKMIAEELTLNTHAKFIATHGCIICQSRRILLTLSEAFAYRQRVREAAFM